MKVSVEKADYDYDYTYDGRGRLKSISDNRSPSAVQYLYDKNSNVTQRSVLTSNYASMALNFQYDELNRMKKESIASEAVGWVPWHLQLGYDRSNRLKYSLREETDLLDSFDYSFTGELTNAQFGLQRIGTTNNFVNPDAFASYAFDNAGNRDHFNGVNYIPNSFNQYTVISGENIYHNTQHQIRNFQGITYDYIEDTRLSTVSDGGYQYDLGYDALGRTVRRTMNHLTSYHFYAGKAAILEYDDQGQLTGSTLYGRGVDEVVWHDNNGGRQFLLQDRMGSTVAVANAGGNIVERYTYDAFGTPTIRDPNGVPRLLNQSAINNRILFVGREWVPQFRFYENRARAYHPGLGRFMSEDPIGLGAGDTSLYRYCNNDPINSRDPSGLWAGAGPDPRFNSNDVNALGDWNWALGTSPSAPGSTRGFLTFPDGSPVGRGPGFLGQGGGRSGVGGSGSGSGTGSSPSSAGDVYYGSPGYTDYSDSTGRVWVVAWEMFPPFIFPGDFTAGSLGFFPGTITRSSGVVSWLKGKNFTVDFAQTFGVIPVPAGEAPIPVPVGGHFFATVDKSGITVGVGSGVVAASGFQVMSGSPFGNTSGTQLVSQVFGSVGPFGGYLAGIFSQGGNAFEYGGGLGMGSGVAITLDQTIHFDWPGGH